MSSSKQITGLYCFLSELSRLVELCPFQNLRVIINKDISKSKIARSLKFGQLVEDDK